MGGFFVLFMGKTIVEGEKMIAKKFLLEQNTIRICAESEPIRPGDRFAGVSNAALLQKVNGAILTDILCCGTVNEDEMLFSAESGRYYFSFRNGWGVKDMKLYGMELGLFFDFKHPTTNENISEECMRNYGSYSTWGGAMATKHRRSILDTIAFVVSRSELK